MAVNKEKKAVKKAKPKATAKKVKKEAKVVAKVKPKAVTLEKPQGAFRKASKAATIGKVKDGKEPLDEQLDRKFGQIIKEGIKKDGIKLVPVDKILKKLRA